MLILFAVRDEAKHFKPGAGCTISVTGIGKANVERALRASPAMNRVVARASRPCGQKHTGETPVPLTEHPQVPNHAPQLVLTCGYCGGLNPEHKRGDVIFDADAESGIADVLMMLGAKPGTFHCADRIITTAEEKKALRHLTGADAVEMESGVIRALCRERDIPSATVRVISDDATQDLPMDFNTLSGADGNISYLKLAIALAKSPGRVPELMRFQRELDACSRNLARTLHGLLAQTRQI